MVAPRDIYPYGLRIQYANSESVPAWLVMHWDRIIKVVYCHDDSRGGILAGLMAATQWLYDEIEANGRPAQG